jgi:putative phage-type endonuclease
MQALVNTENMSREEWLSWRNKGLGGSDASVICSLNKYKSPMELWMEKTGQIEPKEAREAAYWGTVMEPFIRNEFTKRIGLEVESVNSILQHPEHHFLLANLDGTVQDPIHGQGIFEAKTASQFMAPQWETGVPDYYEIQVQHYMAVTGFSFAYVAVLIGGNNFKYFHIPRNDEVIKLLIELEDNFWKNHVMANIPPEIDGSPASSELLKRLYPNGKANSCIELPESALELIKEYEMAKADEAEAMERKELASNKLKKMLGENESGVVDGRCVQWKTVSSERFNSKGFKKDHLDLHQEYISVSSYRRFMVK